MGRMLFLFRPEPGWSRTADAARGLGLNVAGEPIFAVAPTAWTAPPAADFDALLAGSANVFRHGGGGLRSLINLPVHAVGRTTADAARAIGFAVEQVGKGGLQSVLDGLAGRNLRLLRLGGEVRVPLSPPPDAAMEERAVYRSIPAQLHSVTAEALRKGGVVMLHSGEAARHFGAECDRLEIDRGGLRLAVLAPRIAEYAGTGWASVDLAAVPSDTHLLALARSLCQSR